MIYATTMALVLGPALDLLRGDPRWLPHPIRGIGLLIHAVMQGGESPIPIFSQLHRPPLQCFNPRSSTFFPLVINRVVTKAHLSLSRSRYER